MHTDTPFAARRARPATPASPAAVAAVAFACLAAGVGCARHGVDVTTAAAEKLTPAATAYVAVPEDGRFGTKVYTGSGLEVAALVAEALSSRLRRVVIAEGEQAPAAALAGARAAGLTYLIRPSILRWEDQPTAWSGGADRAKIPAGGARDCDRRRRGRRRGRGTRRSGHGDATGRCRDAVCAA